MHLYLFHRLPENSGARVKPWATLHDMDHVKRACSPFLKHAIETTDMVNVFIQLG